MAKSILRKASKPFSFLKAAGTFMIVAFGLFSASSDKDLKIGDPQTLFDGVNRAHADYGTGSSDGGGGGDCVSSNCVGGCSNSDGSSAGSSNSGNSECGACTSSGSAPGCGCNGSGSSASSGTGCGLY